MDNLFTLLNSVFEIIEQNFAFLDHFYSVSLVNDPSTVEKREEHFL